jgi:DNA-binding MurR/RpiR family transcriptional regulator
MLNSSENTVYDTALMRKLKDLVPHLKPALRKNAEYILRYPIPAATLNIEEFARRTQTSTAALNRLATAMGLNGFSGLRVALTENLMALVSPVDKVHAELLQAPESGFNLEQQVRLSKGNLDAVLNSNYDVTFASMVKHLNQARRLYLLGLGSNHPLATLAANLLLVHCPNVLAVNVEADPEQATYRLANIDANDVLLAIDLPPYHPETTCLAQHAKDRGATVLALSDSPASPLSDVARHCLFAPPLHPVLRHSQVATLSAIEGLVAALCIRNQDASNESMPLAEEAAPHAPGKIE